MSLAYLEGKDGKLQVAYEAMDKISIFKHSGIWLWYCPCCNQEHATVSQKECMVWVDKHINRWHPDED